ncbi:hypothetical protein [Corynebacterium humireducens]|uniref:hypothetical protein n=1 Tax=Corynebacterium humireducens TaxID=1223514 RepID=UPI000A78E184|nr:hypothetical protein [Corynebacterium humireducens]
MSLHTSPTSDAEWARRVEKRLTALENPRSIRMGNWMVSVSPVTGDLVADHIPTGRRDTLAAAEPRTVDKE